MMNRSTRFLSLSGLSGILAGVYALIGSYVAFTILQEIQYEQNSFRRILISFDAIDQLLLLAAIIALAAILTGILLSYRKAKRLNEKLWNQTAKRMLLNFSIPLVSGGIFCIALLIHDEFGLIAPANPAFLWFRLHKCFQIHLRRHTQFRYYLYHTWSAFSIFYRIRSFILGSWLWSMSHFIRSYNVF